MRFGQYSMLKRPCDRGQLDKEATYERVPRSSTQADAIVANAQTAHAILVANQRSDSLAACHIPDLPHVSKLVKAW